MTGDLRERLRDLAGEMEPLHAPGNLEARVRRREVGVIVTGVVGVAAIVMIAVAGFRALDRSEPEVPANHIPFPVSSTAAPATSALLEAPEGLMVDPLGNLFLSEWYGNKLDV